MRAAAAAALTLVAVACGSEAPQEIPVAVPPSPEALDAPAPFDYLLPDSLAADSLATDSLMADTSVVAEDTLATAEPQPFDAYLAEFQEAARRGDRTAAQALAADGVLDGRVYDQVLGDADFRDGILAASPRDARRDGTKRTLSVVVGYGADGESVALDEADTESGVILTFDRVDGLYRLLRVDFAG